MSDTKRAVDSRGFSLVELITVMVILSALVLISIPTFSNARDKAKASAAMSEIRDIEKLIAGYAIDHAAYPASLDDIGRGSQTDPWGNLYVYSAPTRKDFDFINTDYDLYSKGANGQSPQDITDDSSKDDIIRAADGSFVGLVTRYLGQ